MTTKYMALADLLATVPPGHRDPPWSWEDEERDIAIRLCLCCGRVGHYQETVENRMAEVGFIGGVCIGEEGRLHDGHHRVIAAKHLGLDRIPLETKAEADARWVRDHGSCVWELRQFGDVHPGEAWAYVQNFRQAARDFVRRERVSFSTEEAQRAWWQTEAERFRAVLEWLEENTPGALRLCPYKAPTSSHDH